MCTDSTVSEKSTDLATAASYREQTCESFLCVLIKAQARTSRAKYTCENQLYALILTENKGSVSDAACLCIKI